MNAPIDIVLWCPSCGLQHVDEPDEASGWTNPVHYTHLCKGCGHLWTPSNHPTNGVLGTDIGERKHDSRPIVRGSVRRNWISVKDRLPESELDWVLVAAEFDGPGDWRIKLGALDCEAENGWRLLGASWTPTHWMPLPNKP